jgi:hypothetical protein
MNHGIGLFFQAGNPAAISKDDQIAHHRILAGRKIPTNYGRNNNSPATTPVYGIGFKLEVREPAAHRPWYRELCATL